MYSLGWLPESAWLSSASAVRNFFDYMFMGSLAHLFWLLAAVGITVTRAGWRKVVTQAKIGKPAESIGD